MNHAQRPCILLAPNNNNAIMKNINKTPLALAPLTAWCGPGTTTIQAQYLQLNLAGFQKGMGRHTDRNLNGWAMAFTPAGNGLFGVIFAAGPQGPGKVDNHP